MTDSLSDLYDRLKKISNELDAAMAEVSYLEFRRCEDEFGGHDWEEKEANRFFGGPWKRCKRCGGSSSIPPKPREPLRLVKDD